MSEQINSEVGNRFEGRFNLQELSVDAIEWLSLSLVFIAIFWKGIITFYLQAYAERNVFGGVTLIAGLVLAGLSLLLRRRYSISVENKKFLFGWVILLLIIAPATAYINHGVKFISPQAIGFVAAMVCFLVSPKKMRVIIILTLFSQFLALLYEYHNGVSLTLTTNEAKGIYFTDQSWLINPETGLIRAKGLFDSTHNSTWLYLYSAFIFGLETLAVVILCAAAWLAQGRLAIVISGIITLASPRALRAVGILALVLLIAFSVYPQKTIGGVYFFVNGFDPSSSSNTYRVEATTNALSYLSAKKPSQSGRSSEEEMTNSASNGLEQVAWLSRIVVGASGTALGPATVPSEMDYTLIAIEYGLAGFVMIGWTLFIILKKGVLARDRTCIVFPLVVPLLMFSSSLQAVSSFFMFWLAILYLCPLISAKPPLKRHAILNA